MNSNYSLDTHPLVWYFTGQKTLSPKAKKVLDEIFSEQVSCFLSSIVLLEAFHSSLKQKRFVFSKFLRNLRHQNIVIVPLDKVVLSECYKLPRSLSIHDRVIVATAKVNNCVLITKDKAIQKVPRLKIVW